MLKKVLYDRRGTTLSPVTLYKVHTEALFESVYKILEVLIFFSGSGKKSDDGKTFLL